MRFPLYRNTSGFPPSNAGAGFSLIELLAVMSVLAILASLAAPSLGSIMKGRALQSASDCAWTALSAARQQAISRQSNVALVLTTGRGAIPEKSDAFMLLVATPSSAAGGPTTWTWSPASKWLKLPVGITVKPESNSFLSSSGTAPAIAAYTTIGTSLPKIEGQAITDYTYVVFRPDGSVDAASSNPVLGFKRLNSTATATDTDLVLSPDSGRARFVQP